MSKKSKSAQTPPGALADDQIVRLKDGPKYFGVGKSRLAEMIRKGEVPKPIHFSERCVGWTGRQIHEHQAKLLSE
jgi:predicted DNA-binding transcriptional regulator AlpA